MSVLMVSVVMVCVHCVCLRADALAASESLSCVSVVVGVLVALGRCVRKSDVLGLARHVFVVFLWCPSRGIAET